VHLWPNVANVPTIPHGTKLQTKKKLQVVTARRREEASKQANKKKKTKEGNRNLLQKLSQNALGTTLRSSFFLCGVAPATAALWRRREEFI
jgi:hypothetical protein